MDIHAANLAPDDTLRLGDATSRDSAVGGPVGVRLVAQSVAVKAGPKVQRGVVVLLEESGSSCPRAVWPNLGESGGTKEDVIQIRGSLIPPRDLHAV